MDMDDAKNFSISTSIKSYLSKEHKKPVKKWEIIADTLNKKEISSILEAIRNWELKISEEEQKVLQKLAKYREIKIKTFDIQRKGRATLLLFLKTMSIEKAKNVDLPKKIISKLSLRGMYNQKKIWDLSIDQLLWIITDRQDWKIKLSDEVFLAIQKILNYWKTGLASDTSSWEVSLYSKHINEMNSCLKDKLKQNRFLTAIKDKFKEDYPTIFKQNPDIDISVDMHPIKDWEFDWRWLV